MMATLRGLQKAGDGVHVFTHFAPGADLARKAITDSRCSVLV
jgi:hypothetical protein